MVNSHIANWKITMLLMGKLTISTGPFSIAMLNYQRVHVEICLNMLNYICLYISFPWSSIVITCNDQPGFLPGNPQVSFVKPPSNLVGG